ncbi:hypothetical protein [Campylobacter coli]|uniref:hypothetical protein n=1 Tax=Campylobacter coli TaxID=195 RepID=UPI000ACCFB0E|nr:hypothetical protein [Campylobacter coli]
MQNITSNLIFTNEQVASNYGLTTGLTIAKHLRMHNDEFIENTHYFLVENSFKNKTIKWTLEGVYKLFDKIKKLKERSNMAEGKLLKSLADGVLKINESSIDVAVLENGVRIITHSGVFRALGREPRGNARLDQIPAFMDAKNLQPLISSELKTQISRISYLDKKSFGKIKKLKLWRENEPINKFS